jgi:hypothetical protein
MKKKSIYTKEYLMKEKRTHIPSYAIMLLASILILIVAGVVVRFETASISRNLFYYSRIIGDKTANNSLEKSPIDSALKTLFKILNGTASYTFDSRTESIDEGKNPKTKNGVKIFVSTLSSIDIHNIAEDTGLSEDFSFAIECYVKTSHFPGG